MASYSRIKATIPLNEFNYNEAELLGDQICRRQPNTGPRAKQFKQGCFGRLLLFSSYCSFYIFFPRDGFYMEDKINLIDMQNQGYFEFRTANIQKRCIYWHSIGLVAHEVEESLQQKVKFCSAINCHKPINFYSHLCQPAARYFISRNNSQFLHNESLIIFYDYFFQRESYHFWVNIENDFRFLIPCAFRCTQNYLVCYFCLLFFQTSCFLQIRSIHRPETSKAFKMPQKCIKEQPKPKRPQKTYLVFPAAEYSTDFQILKPTVTKSPSRKANRVAIANKPYKNQLLKCPVSPMLFLLSGSNILEPEARLCTDFSLGSRWLPWNRLNLSTSSSLCCSRCVHSCSHSDSFVLQIYKVLKHFVSQIEHNWNFFLSCLFSACRASMVLKLSAAFSGLKFSRCSCSFFFHSATIFTISQLQLFDIYSMMLCCLAVSYSYPLICIEHLSWSFCIFLYKLVIFFNYSFTNSQFLVSLLFYFSNYRYLLKTCSELVPCMLQQTFILPASQPGLCLRSLPPVLLLLSDMRELSLSALMSLPFKSAHQLLRVRMQLSAMVSLRLSQLLLKSDFITYVYITLLMLCSRLAYYSPAIFFLSYIITYGLLV